MSVCLLLVQKLSALLYENLKMVVDTKNLVGEFHFDP
jgi:hypothetical protein